MRAVKLKTENVLFQSTGEVNIGLDGARVVADNLHFENPKILSLCSVAG